MRATTRSSLVTYIIDIGVEGGVDDVDRLPEERGDLSVHREPGVSREHGGSCRSDR